MNFPTDLKGAVIDTTVVSGHGSVATSNFESTDKLYLLAPGEIYEGWSTYNNAQFDSAKDLTRQLDYYNSIGVTTGNYSNAIKKNGTIDKRWWLRSTSSNYNFSFSSVTTNGSCFPNDNANSDLGVSPAFRIG